MSEIWSSQTDREISGFDRSAMPDLTAICARSRCNGCKGLGAVGPLNTDEATGQVYGVKCRLCEGSGWASDVATYKLPPGAHVSEFPVKTFDMQHRMNKLRDEMTRLRDQRARDHLFSAYKKPQPAVLSLLKHVAARLLLAIWEA